MKKLTLILFILGTGFYAFSSELIEKIEVIGNKRVGKETILFYMKSREGEELNEDTISSDFKNLWTTGFFSDIRIEKEKGSSGSILKIYVEENPVIKTVEYKKSKSLKEEDIKNKLKEKNISLLPYSYYSPYKIMKVEETIKELLQSKGLVNGKVNTKIKRDKNEVEITFEINEGSKIRVGEIAFEGNKRISSRGLRRGMKEIKKHGLISWITSKDIYSQEKLDKGIEKLKEYYQSKGFMEARIGKPRIERIKKRNIFLSKKDMLKLVIQVEEGPQYRLGSVKIIGNKVVPSRVLESILKMKKGSIYNIKQRNKGIENIQKLYGEGGYFYAQLMPLENLDPEKRLVHLELHVQENEQCFLGKLEFKGNTFTKDFVIRREWLLREGDIFNTKLFELSLKRIKQLGLVDFEKFPDVKPDPADPKKINISLEVKELQRSSIQFTGGYSGLEGPFVALSYQTVNLFGGGEVFDVTLQTAKRGKDYRFGFSQPYLFDLPMTVGLNLYNSSLEYPLLYTRRDKGIDFTFTSRIYRFYRFDLSFSNAYIEVKDVNEDLLWGMPWYYRSVGKQRFSSITPTIYYSSIDSPLDPSEGSLYSISVKYSGTFLGGDIHLWKPSFEWKHFRRAWKNHVIGLHFESSFVKPLRNQEIPFWERIYMGGDYTLRGFEYYTIGPRNELGALVGGDKSFLFNFEYQIPIGGPLKAVIFYDVGNVYGIGKKINLRDVYTCTGIEARIFVPQLRVPMRLIFSYNPRIARPEDSHYAFRFAIGTTF
ncbi:MAG: outer membrane protein assembly factor BamA [Candidatus Aminicenantia bacterium]